MNPPDLGLPSKFVSWRPGQLDGIIDAASASTRFIWLDQPTGSGKSATYVAVSNLIHSAGTNRAPRMAILTSTKGLMLQLTRDFPTLFEVKGQNNYLCLEAGDGSTTVDIGECHEGYECPIKNECLYPVAVNEARRRKSVVTNYPFWMHQYDHGNPGLGAFDVLVLDEFHRVPEELSSHVSIHISAAELKLLADIKSGILKPKSERGLEWREWAENTIPYVKLRLSLTTGKVNKQFRDLAAKLDRMKVLDPDWVYSEFANGSFTWEPIWPRGYADRNLFLGSPKVICASATARPKTFGLLGVPQSDVTRVYSPHSFPVINRPLVHIPTASISQKMSMSDKDTWHRRIDEIASAWPQSKGIIHTVSYERAMHIRNRSKHASRMLIHTTETARATIDHFRNAIKPLILLSPSVTTGYDMPDVFDWQVISKVPFPDARSNIMQRRSEEDPSYPMFLAMMEMVQAYGRGPRTPSGKCITYIIDDNIRWMKSRYYNFAPQWVWDAFRTQSSVSPLPSWAA